MYLYFLMISKEHIKSIRSLHQKKFRKERQLFIVEGIKMLQEAIQNDPALIKEVFFTKEVARLDEIRSLGEEKIELVEERDLKKISALQHPQKIAALCHFPQLKEINHPFKIALDTIQDPGNLGTIIRLAAWYGVPEIILSDDSVDVFNPKVVQASMGSIFNVQLRYVDLGSYLSNYQGKVYGTLLDGENVYTKTLQPEGILLLGNEGKGIRDAYLQYITHPLSIPKFGTGESLNIAMASAIFLSEFFREIT